MTVYTRCYLSRNQNHVRFVEPYMLCDLSVVANRTILVVEELLTTFSDALFPFYLSMQCCSQPLLLAL